MTTEQPRVTPTGLYPVGAAAQHLGVRRQTLYNWIREGVFTRRDMPRRTFGRKEIRLTGAALLRVWRSGLY